MSTRGVFQLQRLGVHYCEHGGSSRFVRELLASGGLSQWATDHPHVTIEVKVRNGKHPFVDASYLNKTQHQVGLKNRPMEEVVEVCDMLHNRSGRKIKKITAPVISATPTVQGVWTPFLDVSSTPFSVTIVDTNQ